MKYPGSGGKLSGEVAVKQNSSTKAMSGCQDIPERESKVELNELNLIYDHEQQGLIYDNGTSERPNCSVRLTEPPNSDGSVSSAEPPNHGGSVNRTQTEPIFRFHHRFFVILLKNFSYEI